MCRDGIPPKNCAAVIILALSSSGAKCKYFLTSAQGFEGLDHYPKVSRQKKVEFDRLVGRDVEASTGMFRSSLVSC